MLKISGVLCYTVLGSVRHERQISTICSFLPLQDEWKGFKTWLGLVEMYEMEQQFHYYNSGFSKESCVCFWGMLLGGMLVHFEIISINTNQNIYQNLSFIRSCYPLCLYMARYSTLMDSSFNKKRLG